MVVVAEAGGAGAGAEEGEEEEEEEEEETPNEGLWYCFAAAFWRAPRSAAALLRESCIAFLRSSSALAPANAVVVGGGRAEEEARESCKALCKSAS